MVELQFTEDRKNENEKLQLKTNISQTPINKLHLTSYKCDTGHQRFTFNTKSLTLEKIRLEAKHWP